MITSRPGEIKAIELIILNKFQYAKNIAMEGGAAGENWSESAEIGLPQFFYQGSVGFEGNA